MTALKVNRESDALIVVDVQPAFMPGGGLAIDVGPQFIPRVRQMMSHFDIRFATLDCHPEGHISFASSYVSLSPMTVLTPELASDLKISRWSRGTILVPPHAKFSFEELMTYLKRVRSQVLWPDHAVIGTLEAELHPSLFENEFLFMQVKGRDLACDSYSGFYDNLGRSTGFKEKVVASGAKRLFICGLAFDFCVGWTALDARKNFPDMEIFVIEDACRSVDVPGSVDEMKKKLTEANIQIIDSYYWS